MRTIKAKVNSLDWQDMQQVQQQKKEHKVFVTSEKAARTLGKLLSNKEDIHESRTLRTLEYSKQVQTL